MKPLANAVSDSIYEQGFAIVRGVLATAEREELIDELGPVIGPGRRRILELPLVARLAYSDRVLSLVQVPLSARPRPVRAIYFDKNPETNWMVAWHQDLTIAVRNQIAAPGFGPWSIKNGVPHVQPPVHMLEQMLTLRLHLDDCDESNGALQVIPGSHRSGRLSARAIQTLRSQGPVTCCAAAGDALLMRPLLLHSSARARTTGHRRVVHIEHASFELPDGLQWHEPP